MRSLEAIVEKGSILNTDFYQEPDVVGVALKLLGKVLVTHVGGILTCGIITETEAYAGETDRASHAFNGRRTARTSTMYRQGGVAYIYLCYGMHALFNVVTNSEGIPHAVLVRAVWPLGHIDEMLKRTNKSKVDYNMSNGPGKLSKALGMHIGHNGTSLTGNLINIRDCNIVFPEEEVVVGPRVGIDYAGEDASLPYRFKIRDSFLKQKRPASFDAGLFKSY